MTRSLVIYLVIINLISFCMFGVDKSRAQKHEWRISERSLLSSAWLGGGVGALAGMRTFHHKTLKMRFRIQVPLSIIVWAAICLFLIEQ